MAQKDFTDAQEGEDMCGAAILNLYFFIQRIAELCVCGDGRVHGFRRDSADSAGMSAYFYISRMNVLTLFTQLTLTG